MSDPIAPPSSPARPGRAHGIVEQSTVLITALRVSEAAPSVQEDCVRQLLHDLEQAGYPPPRRTKELEGQVDEAFRVLSAAGLLDADKFGRCSLTLSGRQVLRENPDGLAASALAQYPE